MAAQTSPVLATILKPMPFASDLIDAMAMRLWRETCLLIEVRDANGQRWPLDRRADATLYDLPFHLQDELRASAVALLGMAVSAIQGDGAIDRLAEISDELIRIETAEYANSAPGESGEVATQ